MTKIEQFITSIEVENTAKVVRHVLDGCDANLDCFQAEQLQEFILNQMPNSPKAITTICYVIGLYARWLANNNLGNGENLYELTRSLDKTSLWRRAKPVARQKFISNKQFVRLITEIELYEQFNSFYYQTLFRSIYEGIYNNDMSVLKNLRASDVKGNIVVLREDNGHTYTIEVSNDLAHALKTLSKQKFWNRMNRYGVCNITMTGLYINSVFKIEERKGSAKNFTALKFSIYSKLRKITQEYLDYHILPFHLYISGLMHRIKVILSKNNITLEDAFCEKARKTYADSLISQELQRSNYESDISHFKEIVKGHLDSF